MKFVVDAMLPPLVAQRLNAAGHIAFTPGQLGAHSLPDDVIVEIATTAGAVIVTENASDFAHMTACPVLFVRKSWWPRQTLASDLSAAVDRWAAAHPDPGAWPHWLRRSSARSSSCGTKRQVAGRTA